MTSGTRSLVCQYVIGPSGAMAGPHNITIEGGLLASIEPVPPRTHAEPLVALPALANAHDHGRAIRTSSIGGDAKPLETWLPYLMLFPPVDPYLAAAVYFANGALGGAGTIMVHYTRAQGFTDLPTEAAEVARAARDIGIRAGFAVSIRDRNLLVYGPAAPILDALDSRARAEVEQRLLRQPLSPEDYLALVGAVASAAENPEFNVQYGPAGVQWCSEKLLEAIAEASHRTGRRIHMHLLETRYQRQWADTEYPGGIVRMLDRIGLLSPRLTLAHCVWARPDELELLAERGVIIVTNTSSNLHLHSGIAPVRQMLVRNCRVAFGVDGKALDDDDDLLRETRLTYLLHAGKGFDLTPRSSALQSSVANGRFAVTNTGNTALMEPGAPADLLLLDWNALEDDRLCDGVDPLNLIFSRAAARHIQELIVAGRTVARDRKVLGIDFPAAREELLAQMRSGMKANLAFSSALLALEKVIASYYGSLPEAPCC
jgi:cytosine/adenosine deaminase-related metal-dependent hydrolase